MQFEVIKIGQVARDFGDLEAKYDKFLKGMQHSLSVTELKPEKNAENEIIAAKEATALNNKIDQSLPVVLLTEHGKTYDSKSLATYLERLGQHTGKIQFIIGGPYGFPANFVAEFPEKLALSELTMPHDLAYIVLLEQLYRSATIWAGKGYDY